MAVDRIPREWQALEYLSPREVLLKFAEAERQFAERDMPDKVRSLRVRSLRPANYLRQAALFCYGMSHTSRLDVRFALFEDRDTDCVARWLDSDTVHYCPIQLKELVPEHVNASAEIESELGKLTKYTDAREIVVALYINRRVHLDFPIKAPAGLGVSELWVFGATSSDLRRWMLYGNILGNASKYEYEYPS
jgi:hypothetical protein